MENLKAYNRQQFAFGLCLLLIVGLLTSPFLLSVSMTGLIVVGILRKDFMRVLQTFFSNKAYMALTGIFIIALLGGIHSSDFSYLSERLRIKIPFLLMPLAFAGIPAFSKRQFSSIFYFLLILMTLSGIGVLLNYIVNYEAFMLDIKQGRSIDTPINHIRFSLLAALSIISGFFLWKDQFYWKFKWERPFILIMIGFLFLFIHVLSVRSGILAVYGAIFILILQYIILDRRFLLGAGALLAIIALPVLAFLFVPSFQTKVYLTWHDFMQYQEGKIRNHSDSQRLVSYEMAVKATKNNSLIGVGTGDLKTKIEQTYQQYYPSLNPKLPHNQFIFVYVGCGMLGLIFFTLCFFTPLFFQSNYLDGMLLGFYVIVLTSFMVEATIETALGTAFYLFFVLLILHNLANKGATTLNN